MNRTLLVVDDDKGFRNVLDLSFTSLGYAVMTAENGEQGGLFARQYNPDCMILDVMMPDKNGYTVCLELKRDPATARIPIILLTAKSLKDDAYWGYDCGADAYMTKPYEPRELESLVERLIIEAGSGIRSTAWTGLPTAGRVLGEAAALHEAGQNQRIFEVAFPEEAKDVFIQKYGNAAFRDLVHTVAWKIYEVVREEAIAALVGQQADDSFIVLTHPLEAERVRAKILKATPPAIDEFYNQRDRATGAILFLEEDRRYGGSATPREAPLLRLQWSALEDRTEREFEPVRRGEAASR